MRHRFGLASCTGLGRGPGSDFGLDNDYSGFNKEQELVLGQVAKDFITQFDSKETDYKLGGYEVCDFGWIDGARTVLGVGLEPSYQWDKMLVFQFDFEDKCNCLILTGTAFGPYGSDIALKMKYYKDYKRKSKLIKFIDKWYDKLKEVMYED